jgi:hypothetical protein
MAPDGAWHDAGALAGRGLLQQIGKGPSTRHLLSP